jgi:hypothetical protein
MQRDGLRRTCIFHPVESIGHVVYSGASVAQNGDALFFMLSWDWYRFDKKHVRTRYAEVVFLHSVDQRVT